jgi:glycosyltransferase involved in cell wall biosynthesis
VRINQILIGASDGDAITSMALEVGKHLARVAPGGIYAMHRSHSVEGEVTPFSRFPITGHRSDIIIYHASFGDPRLARFLLSRPERLVLVYHNITPADFLLSVAPDTAAQLLWGRHELTLLQPRVELAVAVSSYNGADLAGLGYGDVKVISPGLRPGRLVARRGNPALDAEIRRCLDAPMILCVAQMLPHKRIDFLLEAFHILRAHIGTNAALVVVGATPNLQFAECLRGLAQRLTADKLWFTNRISDDDLATYFRRASVFATASEHEGLCIPPLEAMSFGVPVIARAFAAIPETVGRGGIVLPPEAGPALFAEAIAETIENESLRHALVDAGRARLDDLAAADGTADFLALLESIV